MDILHNIYKKIPLCVKVLWRKSPIKYANWGKRYYFLLNKNIEEGSIFYDEGILAQYKNKEKYFSQFGQDVFLDKIIFDGKKDGFFIDIGANHPSVLSNTLFFEQLGWKGIAFEPQEKLCGLWKERKTVCYNMALGDTECEIEFAEYEGDSGNHTLAGVASRLGKFASKKYMVKQRRLGNVLKELKIEKVDFVSMDVEGYEMNVLRGIDFEAVSISCFVIENNKDEKETIDLEIREFMKQKGYRFAGRLVIDDIFVKD